jgi:chromosome segregation ATPase
LVGQSQSGVLVAARPASLGAESGSSSGDEPLPAGELDELLPPDEDLLPLRIEVVPLEGWLQNTPSIVSPASRQPSAVRVDVERLREENEALRCELEDQNAEVERLQGVAERLLVVRAKCDQLYAERVMMERETASLHTRLTEVQVTLIGVEADLDEERSRYETERRAWQEQLEIHGSVAREAWALRTKVAKLRALYDQTREERDEALAQVEVLDQRVATLGARSARLSAYLDEAQAERRASDQAHQAQIERLDAALREALDEAESALERHAALETQIQMLQAGLTRPKGRG